MSESGASTPGKGWSVGAILLMFLVLGGLLAPGVVLYRREVGTTRRLAETRLQVAKEESEELRARVALREAEIAALRAELEALKGASKGPAKPVEQP